MERQHVNVLTRLFLQDTGVNKVANIKTDQIGLDTYYFSPGQVLAYHQHPESDQLFIVLQGNGRFYLDDGTEAAFDVGPGSIILAPRGVWHQLVNTGETPLVASQVTRLPVSSMSR